MSKLGNKKDGHVQEVAASHTHEPNTESEDPKFMASKGWLSKNTDKIPSKLRM